MQLFIIESPGKIKTISSFLPRDFVIKASVGHCFSIKSDTDIDFKNNYKPTYRIIDGKTKVIQELKSLAEKAENVYFATDNDREGMAIAKLLLDNILSKKERLGKAKRVIYNEITKSAILKAIDNPTEFDDNLFHAQQARSVLDLLVGFKISPVLWNKVRSRTSAGRVQSIGLKLIVERQREIDKFVPKEYWSIQGDFITNDKESMRALYHSENEILNGTIATQIKDDIKALTDWYVHSIVKTKKLKSPYPIFNTSSLQQFCSNVFGWDGKYTMSLAQKLYEGGHITYHRTDSLNISDEAIVDTRRLIASNFGKKYCPLKPRLFKTKNKVAQEAHEGIRPTHLDSTLKEIESRVSDKEFKLYEAIYIRFFACQMSDAETNASKILIKSKTSYHEFTANGQIISFDGYLKIWNKYSNTKNEELPFVNENDKLVLEEVKTEQHFTKPPASYNTASLVKVLEEEGIGRPSTYAGIIDNLIKRTYVEKDGKSFKPTELGFLVNDFLVVNFPELMDIKYTARIEGKLDDIANGNCIWYDSVDEFYKEIKKRIIAAQGAETLKKSEVTDIICPVCNNYKLVKRSGKYGDFYGCSGFIEKGKKHCKAMFKIGPKGEPIIKVVKFLEGVVCDKCGSKIAIRKSDKIDKEFYACSGFPKCKRLFSFEGIPLN
ncbi:MAG: type I DNA topoisomerase [Candidatus Nanoarchaeia archaeon]|jgi:DNA topoisomerase-1|nr:type I DNA topoisomerase [Candidatus Nanoarchaeia archaeon]